MSSNLGAIGSYALAVQDMQMSLIKANIDMQKQVIDILLNASTDRMVSASSTLGSNVDVSI